MNRDPRRMDQPQPGYWLINFHNSPGKGARMEKQYRHGDVFLREVAAIPTGAQPIKRDKGRVVLAYGEVTGHAHAFGRGSRAVLFRDDGSGGHRFLNVGSGGADLKHEEHTTIAVPEGRFEVVQQREYSPEAIRNVRD